ncbi:hypothetical protein MVEN_00649600 [Mycena venus]|uniref:Uncharacterized protein n=1 Tax=Mycena venus TaxID=2733690 RepID=A0A8H7D695_9AGAR|nr:hypothetical protein MVEN_00649600 [Mycena venus]
MPTPATYSALLTAIAQVPLLSLANWMPGSAVRINFYTDVQCSQYDGAVEVWWTMSPFVGGPGLQAECIPLDIMPRNSQSINPVSVWGPSVASTTTEPALANGSCTFWDGSSCTGSSASSNYTPGTEACLPASSRAGILWKGAQWELSRLLQCIAEYKPAPVEHHLYFPKIAIQYISLSLIVSILARSWHEIFTQNLAFGLIVQHLLHQPIIWNLDITVRFIILDLHESIRSNANTCSCNKTLTASTIAGLTAGLVSVLVLIATAAFCIWRARRKRETVLPTQGFPPLDGQHRPPVRQKAGAGAIVTVPELHVQGTDSELGQNNATNGDGIRDLELAMRQNSILEARISALERELRPQPSDSSLPGYREFGLSP